MCSDCSHIVTFITLLGHLQWKDSYNQIDHILKTGDSIQVYFMGDHSGKQTVILTSQYLVVAKVRERLVVKKQTSTQ
jgi:hypothetical protein